MKLDVRHLELLVAIEEEGSMTKASERLNLTQSALSHQLRDIEERLGTALYLRLNKKMILTYAGQRVLRSARSILDELKRTEEDINEIALNREGIVRISTQCYTSYHWLPAMLKNFNQKYPSIKVQIEIESTRRPVQALLEGKIDVAIVNDPVHDKKLLYRPIFNDELLVLVSPDHPLSSRKYVRARDFIGEHLISHSEMNSSSRVFRKVLEPAGVLPKKISQVHLTEAVVAMVKAGIGISIMARWAVEPHLKSGELLGLPLTRSGIHRQWGAVIIKSQPVPCYLAEFVALISAKCPKEILKMGNLSN